MENCTACHHILWVLLNLMQVGEGNQVIAQVEIEHAALMQMLSKCSGCLHPRIVQSSDLHFYVQGLLSLPREHKVVDTKLLFCLSA